MEGGEMRMELDSSPSSSPAETQVEAEAWGIIPSTSCLEDKVGGLKLGTNVGMPPGFKNLGEEPRVSSPFMDEAEWHEEERLHLDLIRAALPQPEVEELHIAIEAVGKTEALEDEGFPSLEDEVSLPFFHVNAWQSCRTFEGEAENDRDDCEVSEAFAPGYESRWRPSVADSPASPPYLPTSPRDSLPSHSPMPTEMSFGEVYESSEGSLWDEVFKSPQEALARTGQTYEEGLAEVVKASLQSFMEEDDLPIPTKTDDQELDA
jgi:hypothetical protein